MITVLEETRHSWLRRTFVSPMVRLLRQGASPQRLAWSVAAGMVIGINPLFGTSTVVTLLVAQVFRLNHPASQIGVHGMSPMQLLLMLPFLHAGSVLFGTAPVPLSRAEILALVRTSPMAVVRTLWMWEWHALVVWLGVSVVLLPSLALLLTQVLQRARRLRKPAATHPHAA